MMEFLMFQFMMLFFTQNKSMDYGGMMSYLNLQLNRPLVWQFEV